MANLTLGRLQELREAGCERMIERLAFSVLPLQRRGPAHRCINSALNELRVECQITQ